MPTSMSLPMRARSQEMDQVSQVAARLIPLLDLTALGDEETAHTTAALCDRAIGIIPPVAGVCLWPRFIGEAKSRLTGTGIRVITVANFPDGAADVKRAERETAVAVASGADEVDVVIPFRDWLAGNRKITRDLVAACRSACGERALLKVILETGVLGSAENIKNAARDVVSEGADFVKTSTGKRQPAATPEAARAIFEFIRSWVAEGGRSVGFKAAGGIRTVGEAAIYLALADELLGSDWAQPGTFRIGASALLDDLLQAVGSANWASE